MKFTIALYSVVCARLAAALFPSAADLNTAPASPPSTICGEIVAANQNLSHPYYWFKAAAVKDCLTSVPFDAAVASGFVVYYNQTLQFQSTTAFLRNPPSGYQQPAFDLFGQLNQIQDRINSGYYKNQLAFDIDFQSLQLGAHDTHVGSYVGALSQFTFAAPFYITSLSVDGKQLPEVYMWDDAANNGLNASPIESIDGVPVVQYLEEFAARQSFGMLEPDADWNQLMFSPAQNVSGAANVFTGGATFYPGDDFEVVYKNNKKTERWEWIALYNSPGFTGPLETGGDFYNYFVLGNAPANWETTWKEYYEEYKRYLRYTPNLDREQSLTSWHSVSSAYPSDTISHQSFLNVDLPGYITGYYFDDTSTAVISIPSFVEYGPSIGTFSQAVIDFINNATARNATNVIIDLQQNGGGQESLVYDTFFRFFPAIAKNSSPSRMRSHELANELGSIMTPAFQNAHTHSDIYNILVGEEWVVTDRINAQTGSNFTSWEEFYGPLDYNGDTFSLPERYNLSSSDFDAYALGIDFPRCYYKGTCGDTAPWDAKNIVLLTDGICGSSCSLFVELMTYEAGVKSIVVGGRPQSGPMQTASGSRGALLYTDGDITTDFAVAHDLAPNATLTYSTNDGGLYITFAGINLRDQIRLDSNGVPNQFLYLPADCRIYWSLANFNNYAQLWHDAWNAIYNDTSLCVPGSVNATAPSVSSKVSFARHSRDAADTTMSAVGRSVEQHLPLPDIIPGLEDGLVNAPSNALTFCDGITGAHACGSVHGARCEEFKFGCTDRICKTRGGCKNTKSEKTRKICVAECRNLGNQAGSSSCNNFETCIASGPLNSKLNSDVHGASGKVSGAQIQSGYCLPDIPSGTDRTCSSLDSDQAIENFIQLGKKRR